VDDTDVRNILSRLVAQLTADGHIHILELVSPGDRSLAQLLANWDRGKFPRRLEHWRTLFEAYLNIAVFESNPVKLAGATLWNMVYCKGKAKQ
jgi:hypothetical protein